MARRPLRVEELAELLTFNFKGGVFRLFRRGCRQKDLVNAVQTAYSSLFAIDVDGGTTIIRFSHFSVQEFFDNAAVANASADDSYYHVPLAPSHTLLAHACLDVLLRLDENVVTRDSLRGIPLAEYAAEHWHEHARFGNVWQNVEDKVKRLFDPRKRHLATCLRIHDPEVFRWMRTEQAERPLPLTGTILHYAVLWDLHAFVKFLVIKLRQDVQAPGFTNMETPLHIAAKKGHLKLTRFLLECGAKVGALDKDMETPLHLASRGGQLEVARFLMDHGAYIHAHQRDRRTPLHLASREGQLEVARFLIDRGADRNARDLYGLTPLHLASRDGQLEVARFLAGHGADVNALDLDAMTPLHLVLREGQLEVARILIDHGADVNARGGFGLMRPLHLVSREGQLESARFLIDHGAIVDAQDAGGLTSLQLASQEGQLEAARLLIDHGAYINADGGDRRTPLHLASRGSTGSRSPPHRPRRGYECPGRVQSYAITSGVTRGSTESHSLAYRPRL